MKPHACCGRCWVSVRLGDCPWVCIAVALQIPVKVLMVSQGWGYVYPRNLPAGRGTCPYNIPQSPHIPMRSLLMTWQSSA